MPGSGLTDSALPVFRIGSREWLERGSPPMIEHLRGASAVLLSGHLTAACERRAKAVLRARREWTSDFGAGSTPSAARSIPTWRPDVGALLPRRGGLDARVERRRHAGGVDGPPERRSWAGRSGHSASADRVSTCFLLARRPRGVVFHFDVEGLTPLQLRRGHRAVTVVWMLQPAEWGGGLRIWDTLHGGSEHPTDAELATPHLTLRYRPGDVLFSDSRRLHQIRPFRGSRDRISITAHAVEVDRGVWEIWF